MGSATRADLKNALGQAFCQVATSADGNRLGPFDGVRRAHFAPDGRVALAAKRAQTWTWFGDGGEEPARAGVEGLRFSDDAKHLAYVVRGARGFTVGPIPYATFVLLDGVPQRAYTSVMPGTLRFVGQDSVRYVAIVQETKGGP